MTSHPRVAVSVALALLTAGAAEACPPPCPADWDHNYRLSIGDVFAFVHDWFEGNADFNNDGTETTQDVFSFLGAWFTGCTFSPDLVVTSVAGVPRVTPGCPFDAQVTLRNDGNSPASGTMNVDAWMSLDGICCAGPGDAFLGFRPMTLFPSLAPGESRGFTLAALPTPGNLLIGNQYLIVRANANFALAECNYSNNLRAAPQLVSAASVSLSGLSYPSTMILGETALARFNVTNNSTCALTVPVLATLGDSSSGGFVNVPPLSTVAAQLPLTAPHCGYAGIGTVTFCANLPGDPNAGDNCQSASVDLLGTLSYEIIPYPGLTACQCRRYAYQVRVTNVGHMSSAAICSRTGICADADFNNYTRCIGGCGTPNTILFPVPSLAPGQSTTLGFFVDVCCNAFLGTQYVKAGPDRFNGCTNVCGIDARQSILVRPPCN